MSTITLFCLIHGSGGDRAFKIKITKSDTVADLKKLIMAEVPHALANVDANDITLWKVNIPAHRLAELDPHGDIETFGGVKLSSLVKIQKEFPDEPADEHLHIIVQVSRGAYLTFVVLSCEFYRLEACMALRLVCRHDLLKCFRC